MSTRHAPRNYISRWYLVQWIREWASTNHPEKKHKRHTHAHIYRLWRLKTSCPFKICTCVHWTSRIVHNFLHRWAYQCTEIDITYSSSKWRKCTLCYMHYFTKKFCLFNSCIYWVTLSRYMIGTPNTILEVRHPLYRTYHTVISAIASDITIDVWKRPHRPKEGIELPLFYCYPPFIRESC
jgi:hypothetical protein